MGEFDLFNEPQKPADDFSAFDQPVTDKPEEHFFPRSFAEAGQQLKTVFGGIKDSAVRANDFAANALAEGGQKIDRALGIREQASSRPIAQIAANPGASFREGMRGVNGNIPFANQAVEAAGGPPAVSTVDTQAAPAGLGDFAGIAAAPGVGKMVGGSVARAAEAVPTAIARAVTAQAERGNLGSLGKKAGFVAGGYVGHQAGGWYGAGPGAYVGSKLGKTLGKGADRMFSQYAEKLAAKEAERAAAFGVPAAVPDMSFVGSDVAPGTSYAGPQRPALGPVAPAPVVDAEFFDPNVPHAPPAPSPMRALPPRSSLAPLVPEPAPPPTKVPPGFPQGPHLDEFTGQPVTEAGKGGFLPTDAPTAAKGSFRADVIKTARALKDAPYDVEAPADVVSKQLEDSLRILNDLKAAHKAGTLTHKMVAEAHKAGLPAPLILKAVGR